jgi:hypothetical protein
MTQNHDGTWSFDHDNYRTSLLEGLERQQRRTYERRLLDGLRDELDGRPELLGHLAKIVRVNKAIRASASKPRPSATP